MIFFPHFGVEKKKTLGFFVMFFRPIRGRKKEKKLIFFCVFFSPLDLEMKNKNKLIFLWFFLSHSGLKKEKKFFLWGFFGVLYGFFFFGDFFPLVCERLELCRFYLILKFFPPFFFSLSLDIYLILIFPSLFLFYLSLDWLEFFFLYFLYI